MSINSRLKPIQIISQKKCSQQKTLEYICRRKETVDNDKLTTSENGDRKTCQINENIYQKNKEEEAIQPVQMIAFQCNAQILNILLFSFLLQSRVFFNPQLTLWQLIQRDLESRFIVSLSQVPVFSQAPLLVLDYGWLQNPLTYRRIVTPNWY